MSRSPVAPEMTAPGREMDAMIAGKIFGAVVDEDRSSVDPDSADCWRETPHFSTDIAAAWTVVEKLRRDGYGVHVGGRPDAWEISIINAGGIETALDDQPTAPLAIGRAALSAITEAR